MYSLIGLATVSLAAVGFSGWIINGSVNSSVNNVTVKVSNVADRTTVIEFQKESSNLDISFDYDNSAAKPNKNIIYDTTNGEDLEFSIVYTIESNSALNDGKHQISINFDENTLSTFNTLNATNKYIDYSCLDDFSFIIGDAGNVTTNPTTLNNIKNNLEYTDATYTAAKVTSTFTFAWGEYFNGKNPCEYGNGVGDKDETDYRDKLTNFGNDVKDKTFSIALTISSTYDVKGS